MGNDWTTVVNLYGDELILMNFPIYSVELRSAQVSVHSGLPVWILTAGLTHSSVCKVEVPVGKEAELSSPITEV